MAAPPTNALLHPIDPFGTLAVGGTVEELSAGQVLLQPGEPETDVYFPVTAVVSLMSTMASGDCCEVTLVGREGLVGLSGVLGALESSTSCVVQVGGTCVRASAQAVRTARQGNATVRAAFDRYTTSRLIQVAQVAACSRLHPINGRLARWLLMLRDRIDRDHLQLSQQSIANSLGVHRPTIAIELQRLHATGAITYRSRTVNFTDRARLESLACECYDALHREYVHLFRRVEALGSAGAAGGEVDGAAIEVLRGIAGRLLVSSLAEQAARERAEASDRAKDDRLAVVSYELRSTLQAIIGWCTLAKLADAPPEALDVIERNARIQATLIDDLLGSARMPASPRQVS